MGSLAFMLRKRLMSGVDQAAYTCKDQTKTKETKGIGGSKWGREREGREAASSRGRGMKVGEGTHDFSLMVT